MERKYCKRGHELTPENTRGGNRCRACGRLKHAEWATKHQEKMSAYKNEWKKRNPEKTYYSNNKSESAKKRKRRHHEKNRDKLTNTYIANLICQRSALTPKDIPAEMLEAKRLNLTLKRVLKEAQQ